VTPAHSWLRSLNCDGRFGGCLLGLLAVLGCLALGGEPTLLALRYERTALAHGEWWRLLSAHFVHLGVRHLLLDSAAVVLLWVLYARELSASLWIFVLLGTIGTIDAGLWWANPQVLWYVGVSGVLHGVWAAGAAHSVWRDARRELTGWLLLAALGGKLLYEYRAGESLLVASFPVVTAAHRYGALGGLLALALCSALGAGARAAIIKRTASE